MSRPRIHRRLPASLLIAGLVFTTSVIAAPSAQAATAANVNYVVNLYGDLLDRTEITSGDAGVQYWASVLDLGVPRPDVARAIQNASAEYYGGIVEFSYQRYLDRSADAGGFTYFVDGWRNKSLTLETVTAVLIGSAEYYALHDSNNASFVEAAYFDVLGREPDDAGRAYFLVILANYGRGGVGGVLATSAENRRAEIRFAYDSYLGRTAGNAEVDGWLAQLQSGLRREELDVQLVGSIEYYTANSN